MNRKESIRTGDLLVPTPLLQIKKVLKQFKTKIILELSFDFKEIIQLLSHSDHSQAVYFDHQK